MKPEAGHDGCTASPSLRPSFGAPTALWGPRALHTFKAGAAPSVQPQALCRAHPLPARFCGGGHQGRRPHVRTRTLGRGGDQGSDLGRDQPLGGEGQQALPRPQSFTSCLSPYTAAMSQSPTPPPGRARLSSSSQAGRLGLRAHTDLRVASHVVHVEAQQVAEPVRHEHGSQVDLDHGVHAAGQEANAGQLLQVDAVGQAVHVGPPDTWGSGGGCNELWPLAAWPELPRARLRGTQEALALAKAREPEASGKTDVAQAAPAGLS